jgi:Tfp pilus assembly protein PilN
MEPAARVLDRLDRLERLERARAPSVELLDELRALVDEAERWARAEGDARALRAVSELRRRTGGMS